MSQMPARQVRIPNEDHPIVISRTSERIRVRVGDQWIADTTNALSLREAAYPPVFYVPIGDVDASVLRSSDHATYCPYKGECAYYHVEAGGRLVADAIWYYPEPYASVELIRGHVAFYPDRIDELRVG